MMTLEEVWENLRQDPKVKATMEEVEKSYKLFKKMENLIVVDLEAKLAEYEEIKKKYKTIFLDRFVDAKVEDAKIWKEKYDQLKQQLAEKEKELAYMTKQAKKFNNEAQKYYEDAYCNGFQNQTAIAELEKVIEFAKTQDEFGFRKSGMEIFMFVDQQIKSLKGDANENN